LYHLFLKEKGVKKRRSWYGLWVSGEIRKIKEKKRKKPAWVLGQTTKTKKKEGGVSKDQEKRERRGLYQEGKKELAVGSSRGERERETYVVKGK
jgi:hypothetical protein